jgi:hypothetical protein
MITVVNKYKHISGDNDVYIGCGSVLGNPFTSIKDIIDKKKKAIRFISYGFLLYW